MNHQQLLLSQKLIESPSLGSTKGEGETGFLLINHKVSWTVLQRWNINILAALYSSLQSSALDLITRSSRKLNLILLLSIDGLWVVCPYLQYKLGALLRLQTDDKAVVTFGDDIVDGVDNGVLQADTGYQLAIYDFF